MTLERTAVDHFKKPVDVKVELDNYESRPMHVVTVDGQFGLPQGTVIGSGDLFGSEDFQLPFAGRGRHEQVWEDLQALPGAEIIAAFNDGSPAIITTDRTMYIGRDTCWLSHNFADMIEQFMLSAGVVKHVYAHEPGGQAAAQLDLVLHETDTHWILYAINSPRTLHYDGRPLKNLRIGLPRAAAVRELFSGKMLDAAQHGQQIEVTLDFDEGQTMILVSAKAR